MPIERKLKMRFLQLFSLIVLLLAVLGYTVLFFPQNPRILLFIKYGIINLIVVLIYLLFSYALSSEKLSRFFGKNALITTNALILASSILIAFYWIILGSLISWEQFAQISKNQILPSLFAYIGIILVILSLNYSMWLSYFWDWHKVLSDILQNSNIENFRRNRIVRYAQHTKSILKNVIPIFMVYSIINIAINISLLALALIVIYDAESVGKVLYQVFKIPVPNYLLKFTYEYEGLSLSFLLIGFIIIFLNYTMFIVATMTAIRPFQRYEKLSSAL